MFKLLKANLWFNHVFGILKNYQHKSDKTMYIS
jgi:hypothetical protein